MSHNSPELVALPAELQIKIIEELYEQSDCPYEEPLNKDPFLENIAAVRLTCRSLNAAASDTFLKTWFTQRSIIWERKSLLNLYNIASTAPFNKRLIQLDIAVYDFTPKLCEDFESFRVRMERESRDESCFLRHDRVKEHFLGEDQSPDWPRARAAWEAYKKHTDDQVELYKGFVHVRLLARALKCLSGTLRTIIVNGSQSPLNGAWARGILQEVGISMLNKEKVARQPHTMAAVIRAMHLSDIECCSLIVSGMNVSALQLSLPQRRRFREISYSHLHNVSLRLLDPKTFPLQTDLDVFRSGLLRVFLQQIPNLTNLSLEFFTQSYEVPLTDLLGPRIAKLESLCLGGLTVHANELMDWLVDNKANLEHLQLDYSSLITGSWRDVFVNMRKLLDLKSIYFHFLADEEESIHIPGKNVNDYILKNTDKVDWDSMESRPIPRTFADLAGIVSVVVGHPQGTPHNHGHNHGHSHNHGHNHGHNHAHGHNHDHSHIHNHGHSHDHNDELDHSDDSDDPGHSHDNDHGAGHQHDHHHTGSAPATSNENSSDNLMQQPVTAGPALPPGHPSNNTNNLTQPSTENNTPANPLAALPSPPPHVLSTIQDLFQNALGANISLDFLDALDDEDDMSDDDFLDDEDFDDEGLVREASDTEDDEDSIPEDEQGYDAVDGDGYETDDSAAEAVVDRIIAEL